MKIHTGDTVVVISGKDKGKQGTVIRVLEEQNRLVVEGVNMRTRHIKKTTQQAGSRIVYEASLHASNVMILDPKTKKPTRIGYKIDEKTGKKTRIALASGEAIAKAATAKASKGTKKSSSTTKTEAKTEEKKVEKTDAAQGPATKQPFWKRSAKTDGSEGAGGKDSVDTNVIQTAHRSQGG
jgi:large subunit ribosomal protein L24